jgi:hypothetical protein
MKRLTFWIAGMALMLDVYAAGYSTTQITDNTYPDELSRINAQGDVAWTAWVNPTDTDWTVFKYTAATGTTAPLSGNNVFYDSHRINTRGDVVWMASDGNDQEIFLYPAGATAPVQLTNNDLDDTAPQISDNGDVSWFEQHGVNVGAFLYRYDAQNQVVHAIDFPDSTRQGWHVMNARGDIAWNAEVALPVVQNGEIVSVTYSQEILVFTAATGTVANITQSAGVIDSNQHLLDNGDVEWEAWDELTGVTALKIYRAATGTTMDITTSFEFPYAVGSLGHVAWASVTPAGTYALSVYDPATNSTRTFTAEASAYTPVILGVSARGDVVWRSIIGTNWYSRLYNATTQAIVDLTVTQGFGTYDLEIADNGDVVWSLWDGTDYEVYSYQIDTGVTTRLSNNSVDDGITAINPAGTIVWNRFDLDDSELMLAVKSTAAPELSIDVTAARYSPRTQEAQLKARFAFDGLPAASDVIFARFDDATLLDAAFADFRAIGKGVYKYSAGKTSATLDFKRGTIEVTKQKVNPASVNPRDGVDVEIRFGAAVAFDHFGR